MLSMIRETLQKPISVSDCSRWHQTCLVHRPRCIWRHLSKIFIKRNRRQRRRTIRNCWSKSHRIPSRAMNGKSFGETWLHSPIFTLELSMDYTLPLLQPNTRRLYGVSINCSMKRACSLGRKLRRKDLFLNLTFFF